MIRPSVLGDLRAEADTDMLNTAFLETADYRTLIESSDYIIVVGRRGTGKSALTLQLRKFYKSHNDIYVTKISPDEDQVIGIRPIIKLFGSKFNLVRAGSRLIWKYALLMETATDLKGHYKYNKCETHEILEQHLAVWPKDHVRVTEKLRHRLNELIVKNDNPEELIGNLPKVLDLSRIENSVISLLNVLDVQAVFLIDKLDEGFEPDDIGIGFLDGLVNSAIDIKTKINKIKPILFLRDNIFRSIKKLDSDYTRNIEGHVLRLHWDENALFSFAALRLKAAYELNIESNQKIWDSFTAGELQGKKGFVNCLQLTLYRPRDLLSLLNLSLFEASKNNSKKITVSDIESSAQIISDNRLEDLKKEYSYEVPGLDEYIGVFMEKILNKKSMMLLIAYNQY